jgi:uncharacterized membrane protein YgaE (UPF0421/DUF939 family)
MHRKQLSAWVIAKDDPPTVDHVVQTAVAAVLSYMTARLFRLPEAYWAPMSTVIVMQTNLDAALPVSVQHFAGTAIGAAIGAVTATYFGESVWWFGAAVFVTGLVCVALRIERSAYRYASVTLVIVMLVTRTGRAPSVAIHRFFEVSIGIAVGLLLFALWPEIGLLIGRLSAIKSLLREDFLPRGRTRGRVGRILRRE